MMGSSAPPPLFSLPCLTWPFVRFFVYSCSSLCRFVGQL